MSERLDYSAAYAEAVREIAQLEQNVREWRDAEERLSAAYVRVRAILGAWDTPRAPTGEQVWAVTEAKARTLMERLRQAERLASALRPFAKAIDDADRGLDDDDLCPADEKMRVPIRAGDLREARAALHGWDTET